jgi:DNA-binding CsgD family transcriptional regulator
MTLFEREDECTAIDAATSAAARGAGAVVVFDGPGGRGKTALLGYAEDRASDAGLRVCRAAPGPLERDFAFGVVRSLLEAPVRELAAATGRARLEDGPGAEAARMLLDGAVPSGGGAALAHSVLWLCAELAGPSGLALVIDDGQWADRPSLEVLCYLAGRVGDLPLALVLAARREDPTAPADLLALLAAGPRATTRRLAPLSLFGAARLVRARNPGASTAACHEAHRAAHGDPWLLGELARPGTALSAPGRAVLRRRMAALPERDRRVAAALAVLGDHAGRRTAAELAGVDADGVAAAGDALAAAGLLDPDRERLAHRLLGDAILDDLTGATRERLHRQAAHALAADAHDVEAAAAHLLQCGPHADPDVTALLAGAATAAARRGAPHDAAAYLERALAERAPGDDRARIRARLAAVGFDAGRADSRLLLRAALRESSDADTRVEVITRLAGLAVLDHREDAPGELIDPEPLGAADDGTAAALRAAALDALLVDRRGAARRHELVAELTSADSDGVVADVAAAHAAWIGAEIGAPGADACAGLARRALADGALLAEAGSRASYHLAVRVLTLCDRHAAAGEAVAALRRHATAIGSVRLEAAAAAWASELALRAGRPVDAERAARHALDLAGEGDDGLDRFTVGALAVLVTSLAERGQTDAARELLVGRGPRGDLQPWSATIRFARARLALAEGDWESALIEAMEAGRLSLTEGRTNPALAPWRSIAAVALAHLGRGEEARGLADVELALARRFGAAGPLAVALHARAMAEPDDEARAELCRRAVEASERAGLPLVGVRARLELGRTLLRGGAGVDARAALRPALADADAAGAVPLARRARRHLVATGLRPRRSAIDGVEALTPRQREVGALAAAGRTNNEIARELFLSVKTVETHLTTIYRTLGVRTRRDLGGALGEAPARAAAL